VDTSWIDVKKLKPGDRVGIVCSYDWGREVTTVSRVTASGQIVTAGGQRFSTHGREIGGSFSHPRSLADADFVAEQIASAEKAQLFRGAFSDLCNSVSGYRGYTRPLTPAERAELLALIDQCSEPG
jgi:hypothetical protein